MSHWKIVITESLSGTNSYFYPWGEIIFRKEVMSVFSRLILPVSRLQIPDFSLKCSSSELEVQSFLMVALRAQHLLPQLSVVELLHFAAPDTSKVFMLGHNNYTAHNTDALWANKNRNSFQMEVMMGDRLTILAGPSLHNTELSEI